MSTGLRKIKKHRKYNRPVLETTLSPLATASSDESESIRLGHLESVQVIVGRHVDVAAMSPVAMHLYWTLYTGVLAFWADDTSPNQEDTLAMLDQSIAMFVSWLNGKTNQVA